MKTFKPTTLSAMIAISLISAQGFAADPIKPEEKSQANQSVQPKVDQKTADAAAEKRKSLISDAKSAITETRKALQALDEKKDKEAIDALAVATGKLELVLARNPQLALAPVETEVVTHDVLSNRETVRGIIKEAKENLSDGEVQKARLLLTDLASEIQLRTTNIPLATYPAAIKAITPLIDAGKTDEAKARLQATLNTLVITTEAIPLPKLRAESLLKEAQTLAEKKDRSKKR